ncbi:MAG: ABC transporter permease [Pseudomonadota bacterium]
MDLLVSLQRWINDAVRAYLIEFGQSGDWTVLLSMTLAGVMFGAIHALTPGHSKTILISYLAGSRHGAVRALAVSSLLATTHVLMAVFIALFASQLMERSLTQAGRAPDLEVLSRSLLIAIGFWLLLRAFKKRPRHSEREGLSVAITAGLVPCPLTLFVMVLAMSRGIPEAGLMFAASMLAGIAITLGTVAILTVAARKLFVSMMARGGSAIDTVSRILDGLAGSFIVLFAALDLFKS